MSRRLSATFLATLDPHLRDRVDRATVRDAEQRVARVELGDLARRPAVLHGLVDLDVRAWPRRQERLLLVGVGAALADLLAEYLGPVLGVRRADTRGDDHGAGVREHRLLFLWRQVGQALDGHDRRPVTGPGLVEERAPVVGDEVVELVEHSDLADAGLRSQDCVLELGERDTTERA